MSLSWPECLVSKTEFTAYWDTGRQLQSNKYCCLNGCKIGRKIDRSYLGNNSVLWPKIVRHCIQTGHFVYSNIADGSYLIPAIFSKWQKANQSKKARKPSLSPSLLRLSSIGLLLLLFSLPAKAWIKN